MESLKISVDLKRRTNEVLSLQQGYTYPVELSIFDNGIAYTCTGATAQVHFLKSTGKFSIKTTDITISGNKVSFKLDNTLINRGGVGQLQVVLTKDGDVFGSWAIHCNVFANVIQDESTEDSNIIDVLGDLTKNIAKADPLSKALEKQIPQATPLTNSLKTQIPQATELVNEIKSAIEEGGTVDKRELGEFKKGYTGKEYDNLEQRINGDIDHVQQQINDSSLLPYEGTSIKADNTYYGLTKEAIVKGRTLQNLLTPNLFSDRNLWSTLGVNLTFENGYLVGEGRSVFQNFYISDKGVILKPSTTYTIILDIKENTLSSNTENTVVGYFCEASSDSAIKQTSRTYIHVGNTGTFKIVVQTKDTFDGASVLLKSFITNNTSSGRIKLRFSIFEGDHTNTPIEELPYIEGIESTGDKSKNLINPNTLIDNTTLNNDGVEVSDTRYIATDFIKVNPNTSYFTTGLTVGYEYDDNKNFIRVIRNTSSAGTFLTSSTAGYVRLRNYTLLENKEAKQEMISKCMLHVGTQATPYQEYYDGYKISGKSIGKNLFDIRKWYGALYEDETPLEITEEGKVIVYAKNNDTYTHTGATGSPICKEIERKHLHLVHENTTYTLSMKCEGGNYAANFIQFYDENYNSLGLKGYGTATEFKTTFKTPMRTKFLGIRVGIKDATAGSSLCYSDFQLEENAVATAYEPYQESTYSYILDKPLMQLPNGVADSINFETGVLTRRIRKFIADGTENWVKRTNGTEDTIIFLSLDENKTVFDAKPNPTCLCDKFVQDMTAGAIKYPYGMRITEYSKKQRLHFCMPINSNITEVEQFKSWLMNNPVTVLYELAEPTTEQLTPCQLKSFEGTTHIVSNNTLQAHTSVKIPSNVQMVVQTLRAENKALNIELKDAKEELINTDLDILEMNWETDFRVCELEYAIYGQVAKTTESENNIRAISKYEQAKTLILADRYNKATMTKQLEVYFDRGYISEKEYQELIELMN